jgi:hypothetical protein
VDNQGENATVIAAKCLTKHEADARLSRLLIQASNEPQQRRR